MMLWYFAAFYNGDDGTTKTLAYRNNIERMKDRIG
jgi:hypothetical protein